jgi:hypothetical protein
MPCSSRFNCHPGSRRNVRPSGKEAALRSSLAGKLSLGINRINFSLITIDTSQGESRDAVVEP